MFNKIISQKYYLFIYFNEFQLKPKTLCQALVKLGFEST